MFDKQKVILVLFLVVVALAVVYVFRMEYSGVRYSPELTTKEVVASGDELVQNQIGGGYIPGDECYNAWVDALRACGKIKVWGPWQSEVCSTGGGYSPIGGDVSGTPCPPEYMQCSSCINYGEGSPCGRFQPECRQVRRIDNEATERARACCSAQVTNAYYYCTPDPTDQENLEPLTACMPV